MSDPLDLDHPSSPTLAPWVTLHLEEARRGRTVALAVNSRDGLAVALSTAEHAALGRADGTRQLTALGHRELFAELHDAGFLASSPPPVVLDRPAPMLHRIGRVLLRQEVSWSGADAHVRRAHASCLHRAFGRTAVAAQLVVAGLGVVALAWILTGHRPFTIIATPWQVPFALLLNLFAVGVHELGHALVLVHHDRHVHAVGFRLHLGAPTFYVDSVDGLLLTRRQRLVQAAAGPWGEWLVTSVAAITVVALPLGPASALLARFVVANSAGVLLTLLPFVGLDGSLLLADALRTPDLRQRMSAAVRSVGRGEAFGPGRRWPLLLWWVVNTIVAGALLLVSLFFWYALFGGLLTTAWSSGPAGAMLDVLVAVVLALPLLARLPGHVHLLADLGRGATARARFRLERRWRVAGVLRLRHAGGAELDEAALGILAGRLHRVCLRAGTSVAVSSTSWGVVARGRLRVANGGEQPAGAIVRLEHGDDIRAISRRCTLVVLPGELAIG